MHNIEGMSRIRQIWTYVKGHSWEHPVNKVLHFSHRFFLTWILPALPLNTNENIWFKKKPNPQTQNIPPPKKPPPQKKPKPHFDVISLFYINGFICRASWNIYCLELAQDFEQV